MTNEATTKMTKAQAKNLEILKSLGGTATYGPTWPSGKGLNRTCLDGLVKMGLVTKLRRFDTIAKFNVDNGYAIANQ